MSKAQGTVFPSNQSSVLPVAPPQKFTIDQWYYNNQERFKKTQAQCELIETLIAKSEQLSNATVELTKKNKIATDWQLNEKLNDIRYIKNELLQHRKDVILEIDALKVYKTRLNDVLACVKENAADICLKCIALREKRLGIDLTVDRIEKELRKELEMISRAEKVFADALEHTKEQIRILKALLYYLDGDLENKDCSIQLDEQNLNLKETSLNLCLYYGKTPLDYSIVTEEEWKIHTDRVIMSIMKQLNSTKAFRCYIDSNIKEIINDLINQKNDTNEAFNRRIQETRDAKVALEQQHAEVIKQANLMTENITRLEKEIAEKEGFLALTHTRLGNRYHRPNLELTRDHVENQLVLEASSLREIVAKLQRTLYEAQNALRNLLKVQIQLEEDINVKANTLKIDEVECMTLRQQINYHAY